MQTVKEIKKRIVTVTDTRKITNAMYMIASAKLQRARRKLDGTRPYFNAVKAEIKRIFRLKGNFDSIYFYPATGEHELPGAYAYLVITADKGLAGAYNINVIKKAIELMGSHDENELYVVGSYGRHYFESHGIEIEKSFLYTAQNPSFNSAREIAAGLLEKYRIGEISKIFVIYTDFINGAKTQVKVERLLPFHRDRFDTAGNGSTDPGFEFLTSTGDVLDNIVPSYLAGYIFSALIDSFCCEQSSRMNAMKTANDNAEELLSKLRMQYNHVRQSEITKEITEISAHLKS